MINLSLFDSFKRIEFINLIEIFELFKTSKRRFESIGRSIKGLLKQFIILFSTVWIKDRK
jgi:hypothetical protein